MLKDVVVLSLEQYSELKKKEAKYEKLKEGLFTTYMDSYDNAKAKVDLAIGRELLKAALDRSELRGKYDVSENEYEWNVSFEPYSMTKEYADELLAKKEAEKEDEEVDIQRPSK